jgi:glycosyltransferase involved in cell wall biosynthesis
VIDLLIISYYFPPSGGPGVQRVLKFSRYLPQFGYRPHILTVPESASFPVRDPSLAREIPPEARVYRSPIREFYGLYRKAVGRGPDGPVNLTTTARAGSGVVERLLQAARAACFIPDGRVGWLAGGTALGLRICRQEKIQLIFASGPPFTGHWIAQRLARATGLPLVLDFRDPWTRAPFYPRRPRLSRSLDERLEQRCLRQASAVVSVNRAIRGDFLQRYPDLQPSHFHIIPNGFDPADFEGRAPHPAPGWTLVHTGTMPNGRFPSGLAPALTQLLAEEPALADEIRIRLLGQPAAEAEERFTRPPLDRVVRIEGYQPHEQSVQALLDAQLLLLFIEDGPGARGMLTGKLFEYLASGTPILALAPEGEAAEIIRATGTGLVVRGDDVAAIKSALMTAWKAHRQGGRAYGEPDAAAIGAYARPEQARRLAELFDSLRPGAGT